MRRKLYQVIGCLIALSCAFNVPTLWAATRVNLRQQPLVFSNSFVAMAATANNYEVISSAVDQNHTSHVRIQQTYKNYPVWGADAVMHIPNSDQGAKRHSTLSVIPKGEVTYNGIIYQDLAHDLNKTPDYIFGSAQADKALTESTQRYQQQTATQDTLTQSKASLIVYVDSDAKAHWSYLVTFKSTPKAGLPSKPVYIIDALTFSVYEQWDDIKTLSDVEAGGYGGNPKVGKIIYDGIDKNFPKLTMDRNNISKKCLIENDEVAVKDRRLNDAVASFKCNEIDKLHNVYWNDSTDEVNGAYSPSNDALYAGKMIKALYQDWYNLPVLTDMDGTPLWLNMRVHDNLENAYWDGEQMTFGDGGSLFYPLVSLGIVAHEVSHGFTHQHAGLVGGGEAGGLNEAFSDMAAQAAEFYVNKHNSWKIGSEILKTPTGALRFIDEPTKDCPHGHLPGVGCSINNMNQYYGRLDVHLSCGVFNKLFYLLATSPGWDVKKAFDLMVHANMNYWTYNTSYSEATCGLVSSAKDLKYDTKVVDKAAATVGIRTALCYPPPPLPTTRPVQKPKSTPKPKPAQPIPDDDDDLKTTVLTPWGSS